MNGTNDGGSGIHGGVDPCSPKAFLPIKYRKPSYSKKYNAVPIVSRTRIAKQQHQSYYRENAQRDGLTKMQAKPSV